MQKCPDHKTPRLGAPTKRYTLDELVGSLEPRSEKGEALAPHNSPERQRRPPSPIGSARSSALRLPHRSSAYGRAAVESEVQRVLVAQEGSRNITLNRAAFRLGQLIAARVADFDDVVDELLGAAERTGLPPTESQRTIASGLMVAAGHPRLVVTS